MIELKKLRNERGMTQNEAAEKIGVSRQMLSVFENGNFSVYDANTVKRLCEFYDVSPFEVIDVKWLLRIEPIDSVEAKMLVDAIQERYGC